MPSDDRARTAALGTYRRMIARRPGLPASARLVGLDLAERLGRNGFCWASRRHIADSLGFSDDTLDRSVRALVSAGLLVIDSGGGLDTRQYAAPWVRISAASSDTPLRTGAEATLRKNAETPSALVRTESLSEGSNLKHSPPTPKAASVPDGGVAISDRPQRARRQSEPPSEPDGALVRAIRPAVRAFSREAAEAIAATLAEGAIAAGLDLADLRRRAALVPLDSRTAQAQFTEDCRAAIRGGLQAKAERLAEERLAAERAPDEPSVAEGERDLRQAAEASGLDPEPLLAEARKAGDRPEVLPRLLAGLADLLVDAGLAEQRRQAAAAAGDRQAAETARQQAQRLGFGEQRPHALIGIAIRRDPRLKRGETDREARRRALVAEAATEMGAARFAPPPRDDNRKAPSSGPTNSPTWQIGIVLD